MEGVQGRAFSLPNALTASRIAAIPGIVFLAGGTDAASHIGACALFAAAGITDWLDGRMARTGWGQTRLGTMMDPIADKMLVSATLLALLAAHDIPGWAVYPAAVVVLREIMVSGLREYMAGHGVDMAATTAAKWKTGVQMAALGTLLAGDQGAGWLGMPWLPAQQIGLGMLCAAAALTIASAWGYSKSAWTHATANAPQKGATAVQA